MRKNENLRFNRVLRIVLLIIISFTISLSAFIFYITRDREKYISYNEKSTVDYKVYLKDNDFYPNDYVGKNKGYITSLIESISTDFTYNLDFSQSLSYKYSYRFTIEVDVEDSSNDSNLYHYTEDVLTKELTSNTGSLNINQNIKIDYNKYNDIISKFKKVYELKNTSSLLNIYMYVNIQDIDNSNTIQLRERKISSISIPLTTSTAAIDIGKTNSEDPKNYILIENRSNYITILILSITFLFITIGLFVYLFIYLSRSRTAQMIYDKEIKSIMTNFDSYIQRINGSYNIGTSQVLKIETFNDMLEIRDTLKQPILMLENKEKNGTFFIIPATNSIIYTYAIRVVDIKAKMEGKEIPTYDIAEIPHEDFYKNKKYTDQYIKDQITMTTAMPSVDAGNVIQGSNDSRTDLYNQLEKTRSYNINEIKKADKERMS